MVTSAKRGSVHYFDNFRDFYSATNGIFHVNQPEVDGLEVTFESEDEKAGKDVLTSKSSGELYVFIVHNHNRRNNA